jgi:hypothetical protein
MYSQGVSQSINQAIYDHNRSNLIEVLEVQTDRDIYVAGEIIWFNVNKKSGLIRQSLNFSKIVYLELIDSTNLPVVQTVVRVEEDCQSGAMAIPNHLASGNYVFRAYTRWLRNYPETLFFHKRLVIINPAQLLASGGKERQQEMVRIFPEGGSFMAGHENLVGVEYSGKDPGKRPAYLITNHGDTLSNVQWDEFGKGWVSFIPDRRQKYLLKSVDGHEQNIDVGYSRAGIKLKSTENKRLNLEVNTSDKNDTFQLFGVANGLIVFYQAVSGAGMIQVDLARLPNHKIAFQLIDARGKLASYRWINNEQEAIPLAFSGLQQEYEIRDKISLNVQLPAGEMFQANGTISVVKADLLLSEPAFTNNDQLLFQAEPNAITKLLEKNNEPKQYFPETKGHILVGRVYFDSLSSRDSTVVVVSDVGKTANCRFVIPDENGRFYFAQNGSGVNEMVIQALDYTHSGHSFQMASPFHEGYLPVAHQVFTLDTSKLESIERAVINAQTSAIYQNYVANFSSDTSELRVPNFYGNPAYSIDLTQFIDLTSIEEVFLELMPFANVRGSGENRYITLTYQNKQSISDSAPFILVDGVPIQSVEQLLSTPSDAFVRVEYFNAN